MPSKLAELVLPHETIKMQANSLSRGEAIVFYCEYFLTLAIDACLILSIHKMVNRIKCVLLIGPDRLEDNTVRRNLNWRQALPVRLASEKFSSPLQFVIVLLNLITLRTNCATSCAYSLSVSCRADRNVLRKGPPHTSMPNDPRLTIAWRVNVVTCRP